LQNVIIVVLFFSCALVLLGSLNSASATSFSNPFGEVATEHYDNDFDLTGALDEIFSFEIFPGAYGGTGITGMNGGTSFTGTNGKTGLTDLPSDLDWGDLFDPGLIPCPPGIICYKTLSLNDGPRHVIPLTGTTVKLGPLSPDAEPNGQPSTLADGDDMSGTNDEDGVSFPVQLVAGSSGSVDVSSPTGGHLDAWIDFNGDGDFTDAGEGISSQDIGVGMTNIAFNVPLSAETSLDVGARFRLDIPGGGHSPTGQYSDGEVEDYLVKIMGTAVGGELIPLDSTMVLVAGAQNTAAWMIPVIVSIIGLGIVILRRYRNSFK